VVFRVSFYRGEAVPGPGAVPEALVEPVTPFLVAMKGTNSEPRRCVALEGTVGESVSCGIYPLRPSPCRELQASWSQGERSEGCDRARALRGLAPLQPGDWSDPHGPTKPSRAA
jgi:Fe-S-cluster containining protein